MRNLLLVALCLIISCLSPHRVARYDAQDNFVGNAKPVPLKKNAVLGNPLDYAAKRIGFDVRNLSLPRGHEGLYRFACRFPIIDYVSNRPLYLPRWAEDTAERIISQHRYAGIGVPDGMAPLAPQSRRGVTIDALEILRGTSINKFQIPISKFQSVCPDGNRDRPFAYLIAELSRFGFTDNYQRELFLLYLSFLTATDLIKQGRENLTEDDLKFFSENPGYFLLPDGTKMPSVTGNVDSHFLFIERARRVNYEYIFSAAKILSDAIQKYADATKNYKVEDFFLDKSKAEETFHLQTEVGSVVIAGFGNDLHSDDVALLIDLGGDDTYSNNAGGTRSLSTPVTICIDHSGNDEYTTDSSYVQGFGFLGVGLLVDLEGSDKYVAKHFSQGAGIMGVGILWDRSGDDVYDAHTFCQGAGMFGLGILLDDDGCDLYESSTLGQGAGMTLGIGLLSDLKGNDRYELAIPGKKQPVGDLSGFGQGGAVSFRHWPWEKKLTAYGGVGMLLDASGDDVYRSGGAFSQGGSYLMSLGVLFDAAGNDQYLGGSQGGTVHLTNAILIDKSGDDIYEGGSLSGATAGDRSVSFLIDYDGNDVYKSKGSSYASARKPFALAVMIDYKGNDTYLLDETKPGLWDSFGGVWPDQPFTWPRAILLDLGGEDDYRVANRQNNSERHNYGNAIHLDIMPQISQIKWKDGDVIGRVTNPLPPYRPFILPKVVTESSYRKDIELLQNPDTFIRFQSIGRITDASREIIPFLVAALNDSTHRQFNRDVMECIHYLFVQNKITAEEVPYLIRLLKAEDEEVRILMADNFGQWGMNPAPPLDTIHFRRGWMKTAEDALIEVLKTERSSQVKRFALRSLSTFGSVSALPLARELALKDKSEDVRRVATFLVRKVRDNENPFPLLVKILENDPSVTVRVVAAEGIGSIGEAKGIEPLRRASKSTNVYLQRAAGYALAQLCTLDGVEILIETLSFPTVDTTYNYDQNIQNTISGFVGYDLSPEKRYDQNEWRKWFRENRDKIDIHTNVSASRALTELTESLREKSDGEQIQQYEKLLQQYPSYPRIRRMFAGKLNAVAWGMVTAVKGTSGYNPESGLKYALRAVELTAEKEYLDTLSEAYLVNGQIAECEKTCHEALKQYPNERMFLERLERCKKASQ
ncbi:MAG: HEAT repeat domain-containing protein [Planctomycetota bacterium]|nr:HEAT repeat domain-containing protein [Planctomycetota bacterium]MDI6787673.1 HEAT repeat domain-containing protein [Planctomycetota bacterium]